MLATFKEGNAFILLLVAITAAEASTHCEQKWDDIKAPHSDTHTYRIHLLKINTTEEYKTYLPNTKYQVLLKSDNEDTTFTRFFLNVENENKSLSHGILELYDDEITQFSQDCPDSIIHISQVAKDEISTYWTSPEEGMGCVIFRASVMESQSMWFMDGSLEQKFCQDPKATIDDPGPILPECCACNEAKYELAFEGLWSRYTHPKDFPSKPWNARFSDVIGASHTSSYRFWEYGGYASEGLKQVAENGLTRVLESELKNKSIHIRTIIKARGINFPNITSKTFAVFKVDQQHHLISLVSMIDPSPDWFVGISGLELCLANCSWIDLKELNLYPVDAGTDDGVSYESVDAQTDPQDVIRRITSIWPENSPFYDGTAIDMNPLAKLYIKRQRIYEKECENLPRIEETEEACRVTAWSPWETCSVTCGSGVRLRQRKYKNERAAAKNNCDAVLTNRVACFAENHFSCPPDEISDKDCELTPWGDWTPCIKRCGPESRTRSRNFSLKKRFKKCKHLYPHIHLQQTLDCENPACESIDGESMGESTVVDLETVSEASETTDTSETGETGETTEPTTEAITEPSTEASMGVESTPEVTGKKKRRKKCVKDQYTQWSFWTPCSVTCGTGTKSRSRQIKSEWNNSPNVEKDLSIYECQYESTTCEAETKSCSISKDLMKVICSQPEEPGDCPDGHNDNSLRYYFDNITGKCVVFHYAGCNGNMNNFRTLQECQSTCGRFLEENTGRKKKKKKNRQDTKSNSLYDDKVDCKVSEWSIEVPCYNCQGFTTKKRSILIHPRNGGKACPEKLTRRQRCHKILPECDSENNEKLGQRSLGRLGSDKQVSINCRVSHWSSWTDCTATCGMSERQRTRDIAVIPQGHGRVCPPLVETEDCQVPAC